MERPIVHPFYSHTTETWQYVVANITIRHCVILGPVSDCLSNKAKLTTGAADALLFLVRQCGHTVDLILETHAAQND